MRSRLYLLLAFLPAVYAQSGPHWVATWTTAQPMIRAANGGGRGFNDQTVRMIARTSIGGS